MQNNVLIGAVVAIVIGLLIVAGVWRQPASAPTPDADEVAIRALIADFGNKLKNVSLLAPDAAQQIAAQYAPDVVPELLSEWQANPASAPGRQTSSPWPDRIEVSSVSHRDASGSVMGSVIEVTSQDSGGYAATYPVTIELQKRDDKWLISNWDAGAYQSR